MRTGAASPPRTRRPQPQTPPARAGNRPSSPEFESGRGKVASDSYLTAGEVLALGEALADLIGTPGWRLFDTMLQRMQSHMAMQGIRQATQSKDYVAGKLDCIDDIKAAVTTYVAEAQKVAGASDRPVGDRRVVAAMIPGGRRI